MNPWAALIGTPSGVVTVAGVEKKARKNRLGASTNNVSVSSRCTVLAGPLVAGTDLDDVGQPNIQGARRVPELVPCLVVRGPVRNPVRGFDQLAQVWWEAHEGAEEAPRTHRALDDPDR